MELTDFSIGKKIYRISNCQTEGIQIYYVRQIVIKTSTSIELRITRQKDLSEGYYSETIVFDTVNQKMTNSDYLISYNEAIEKLHANRIKFTLARIGSLTSELQALKENISKWF